MGAAEKLLKLAPSEPYRSRIDQVETGLYEGLIRWKLGFTQEDNVVDECMQKKIVMYGLLWMI